LHRPPDFRKIGPRFAGGTPLKTRKLARSSALMILVAGLFVLGIYFVTGAVRATDVAPADPQPDEGALKPGLAVNYYYNDFKEMAGGGPEIDVLYEQMKSDDGQPGDPLPALNYRTGEGRNVLTSKFGKFVGAHIKGFVKFPEAGAYTLMVTSNDGVRVFLDGKMLHEDTDTHPDRDSEPLEVSISKPGWVALDIGYFQRKGSSALILKWTGPQGGDLTVVPEENFAHVE